MPLLRFADASRLRHGACAQFDVYYAACFAHGATLMPLPQLPRQPRTYTAIGQAGETMDRHAAVAPAATLAGYAPCFH